MKKISRLILALSLFSGCAAKDLFGLASCPINAINPVAGMAHFAVWVAMDYYEPGSSSSTESVDERPEEDRTSYAGH
jgi:hypothetical protein